MANTWPAFWVEPTGFVSVSLRRFTFGVYPETDKGDRSNHEACPTQPVNEKTGYQTGHDCSRVVLEYAPRWVEEGGRMAIWPPEEFREEQWPQVCESCGAPCADGWVRQANQDEYYRSVDGGQWPQSELPVGAMWDAEWFHDTSWKGDDGISLQVMLPPGKSWDHWSPDQPSRDGRPWTRTGDPRVPGSVSVQPSILTPYWHGHLVNGALVEC